MPAQSATQPRADVASQSVASPRAKPVVLALASAFLLYLAYPPADSGYLAWFALAPLFALVRSTRPRWQVYLGAWIGGMAFWSLAVEWIRRTDETAWLPWLALAAYLALYWPAFVLLARAAVRLRVPLILAAPIVWVALEYARAYIFTGFPWYYLAHSQHAFVPLIQIVEVTGVWGLSFLVALVNAWWVELLTIPLLRPAAKGPRLTPPQMARLATVVALVSCTLGFGFYRLSTARFTSGPKIGLLQSNLGQRIKTGHTAEEILSVYSALISRAATDGAELVVWPETAFPWGYALIDPKLEKNADALAEQSRKLDPLSKPAAWARRRDDFVEVLSSWADSVQIPMIVGAIYYELNANDVAKYNSAMVIVPRSAGKNPASIYNKLHLVPFGEFVPLVQSMPWLLRLTPYANGYVPNLAAGSRPTWFEVGGVRYAPAICFEDTVPHVVRRFFQDPPGGEQPDVIVNMSNDGWFGDSGEHDAHLIASLFRCVEHRVPMVRAVNTGTSAVIDGNGRVLETAHHMTEKALTVRVPLDDRAGFYSRWGDWFAISCLALTLGLTILSLRSRRLRIRST